MPSFVSDLFLESVEQSKFFAGKNAFKVIILNKHLEISMDGLIFGLV